ncbi:MAG: hypothetical protein V1870_00820 [Candidatus Aenigmatarchaeota archaeon]
MGTDIPISNLSYLQLKQLIQIERGIELSKNNPNAQANFLSAAGNVFYNSGNIKKAASYYEESLDCYKKAGIDTHKIELKKWEQTQIKKNTDGTETKETTYEICIQEPGKYERDQLKRCQQQLKNAKNHITNYPIG